MQLHNEPCSLNYFCPEAEPLLLLRHTPKVQIRKNSDPPGGTTQSGPECTAEVPRSPHTPQELRTRATLARILNALRTRHGPNTAGTLPLTPSPRRTRYRLPAQRATETQRRAQLAGYAGQAQAALVAFSKNTTPRSRIWLVQLRLSSATDECGADSRASRESHPLPPLYSLHKRRSPLSRRLEKTGKQGSSARPLVMQPAFAALRSGSSQSPPFPSGSRFSCWVQTVVLLPGVRGCMRGAECVWERSYDVERECSRLAHCHRTGRGARREHRGLSLRHCTLRSLIKHARPDAAHTHATLTLAPRAAHSESHSLHSRLHHPPSRTPHRTTKMRETAARTPTQGPAETLAEPDIAKDEREPSGIASVLCCCSLS
ncbi:hypothetical protein B0H13DRAFT_2373922 [Mycena leptocephala]|nr:hypothetical protein B0H13DRAFT_2373922 [Mycena leptocephala]